MNTKRKKLAKRIIISLAVLLAVGSAALVIFTGYMVYSNTTQLSSNDTANFDSSMRFFESHNFDYDAYRERYIIERFEIVSSFEGHIIPGDLIYTDDEDNDTVILIHGLGGNRFDMLTVSVIFLENGYNVMIYDQRSAGDNYAPYTTFGYWESHDAADCVAYLDEILSVDKEIHLMGFSQGGATAAIALSRGIVHDRISTVILDCAVSNTNDILRSVMGEMDLGVPMDFLMFSGNLYNRLALGFLYGDVSAEDCLRNSTLPVLILATKADEMTPFFMAENLHNAASGSTLAYVEDSAHCDMFFDYPEWYEEQVFNFLNNQK